MLVGDKNSWFSDAKAKFIHEKLVELGSTIILISGCGGKSTDNDQSNFSDICASDAR